MKFYHMCLDEKGHISLDKFWFFIGMTIISVMYVWTIMHGSSFENNTLIYASLVGGTHVVNTLTKLKYGDQNAPPKA